jgi:4-carboxymuconolactone decarboxylase
MTEDRLERGWETLRKINGPAAQHQWDALSVISPDFARWIVEAGFGEIMNRPGLGLREREIATLAALVTRSAAPELIKAHVEGALNVGVTRDEVVEVIMQMAIYAGVPAAINAMTIAGQVFAERGV